MICQVVTRDPLGFDSLGTQFNWELDKATVTDEMLSKLDEMRTSKTVLERELKIIEVMRTNPETGDIKIKLIADAA